MVVAVVKVVVAVIVFVADAFPIDADPSALEAASSSFFTSSGTRRDFLELEKMVVGVSEKESVLFRRSNMVVRFAFAFFCC